MKGVISFINLRETLTNILNKLVVLYKSYMKGETLQAEEHK